MGKALNKDIRQSIIDRVIKATFSAREDELKAREQSFADLAYKALVPAHFLEIASSLPADYFRQTALVKIHVMEKREGASDVVNTLDTATYVLRDDEERWRDRRSFVMSQSRPFPYYMAGSFSSEADLRIKDPTACATLMHDYQQMIASAQEIVKERRERTSRLNAFLLSYRTVQRVIELAPELKPFIPPDALFERAPVPAPVVGTLITDLMHSGLQLSEVAA